MPVDYQDYENEAQEWADMIADNRVEELADTDEEMLKDLLQEIKVGAFDIDLTGFDENEVDNMLKEIEVPEFEPTNEGEGTGSYLSGYKYFPLIIENSKADIVTNWFNNNLGEEPTDGMERGNRFIGFIERQEGDTR